MTWRPPGGLAVVALLLVVSGVGLVPAEAGAHSVRSAPSAPAAATICGDHRVEPAPPLRSLPDHDPVSARTKAAVEAEISGAATMAMRVGATTGARVVRVRINVIQGTHRKDRRISRAQARRAFKILKRGFNGKQSRTMTRSGFRFTRTKIRIIRNDRWFHAPPGSAADRRMQRTLHRGGPRTLNIYLKGPEIRGLMLLGVARFPWQRQRRPKQDGVVVHVETLPGGKARRYNKGDTIIHETGHWLGLYHTFEGGCGEPGDHVADTPPEAMPSYRCQKNRSSCGLVDARGATIRDPIQNFMNYSFDSCMNHFTPGQIARMHAVYDRYRTRRGTRAVAAQSTSTQKAQPRG